MTEPGGRVVVIDDDPIVLRAVAQILTRAGHQVVALADPVEGLLAARQPDVDLVVSDVRMPNLDGMELLRAVKASAPEVEVILMTAYGGIDAAVEAVKAGAFHYLTKPFERIEDVSLAAERALERRSLRRKAENLEGALQTRREFRGLVGQSAAMAAVYKLVEAVAQATSTILLRGESGTGKELVARAIHAASPRRDRAFVAVNCSALPDNLLESELFGHVKGAFTGAIAHKRGLFEAASGGTLFLDEIGDISPAMQVRLLRVLQEGEVKRVGATDTVPVDVRVVAATHVDLEEAKRAGRFREDLYYRLSVIPISLPPLRERPEDVPLLAQHFLKQHASRQGKPVQGFTREAMDRLVRHGWPGNVRELQHAVERAVVLSQGTLLGPDDLPQALATQRGAAEPRLDDFGSLANLPMTQAKALVVSAFERRYLKVHLERTGGNVTQAALAAGMDRSNFRRLLREYELRRDETQGAEDAG
jgi:DNA-binding NtrC family response regulator